MIPEGYRAPPTDAVLNRLSQEFDFQEIREATQQFSAAHRLGEGTYGTVFRGTLRDGTEVAIKALASPKEGGFREEVEVLSRFRHPNLVILMGFARNGRERYLVYELLPGGDVHSRLNKDLSFTWEKRLNVVLDCALGLSHLHGSRPQVFHRDVKTQNMLMDKNGTGKVADFGLACLAQPNQRSLIVRETSGTLGYADPLYIRSGEITEKSEVYSLGMVLLEVLTGRPPALQHPNGKIEYQFDHLNGDLRKLLAMVDRRGRWPQLMAEYVGHLALQCTCEQAKFRPSFVEIVTQLRKWLRDESLHQPSPVSGGHSPQLPAGVQSIQAQRDSNGHAKAQSPAVQVQQVQRPQVASPWHDPRLSQAASPFGNSLKPVAGGYMQQPQPQQPKQQPAAVPGERLSWEQIQQQQLQREQREAQAAQAAQAAHAAHAQREAQVAREQREAVREVEQRVREREEQLRAKLPFPQRSQGDRSPAGNPGFPDGRGFGVDARDVRPVEGWNQGSRNVPRGWEDGQRSAETYTRASPAARDSTPSAKASTPGAEGTPWARKSWQTFDGGEAMAGATDSTAAESDRPSLGQVRNREEERAKNMAILMGMSFSKEKAAQALERCSTVEAAVEWIFTSE